MEECVDSGYLFNLLFQVKLYRSKYSAFQTLVEELFYKSRAGYQAIEPWGSLGDGGNDGWIEHEGAYFQVYGPKNEDITEVAACNKASEDFIKLQTSWGRLAPIRKYYFVVNTRWNNVPAPVVQRMAQLKNEHSLEDSKPIGGPDLINIFDGLDNHKKVLVVGGLPINEPLSNAIIPIDIVGELLLNLVNTDTPIPGLLVDTDTLPEFQQKIVLNGISTEIANCLKIFSQAKYENIVNAFLTSRDQSDSQSVADAVHELYKRSKVEISQEVENYSDLRFVWMMETLIPESCKNNINTNMPLYKSYREAACMVLAKYFITCDVFEHPDVLKTTIGGANESQHNNSLVAP